jgi:hypothetical protein
VTSVAHPQHRIVPARWRRHGRSLSLAFVLCLIAALNLLLPARLPFQRAFLSLLKKDAGLSATITGTAGTWQTTDVNSAFKTPLQAMVRDLSGTPLSNATVMFSTPTNGPSASFGGSVTALTLSNSSGIATAPMITANGDPGGYQVIASVHGSGEAPAYFYLTNTPAGSTELSANAISESGARHALNRTIYLMDGFIILAAAIYVISQFAPRNINSQYLFSICATAALSVSVFIILATFARDESFAPAETLMKNPGALPVYGQRLLLVWLADAFKFLVPGVSYRRAYLFTQLIATGFATYMVGEWSALFIGQRNKLLGQLLFVAMLIPTITYGTFYDIPLIAVYSLCLFLLYTERYAFLIFAVAIGTLNHENTLLLVPIAALVLWGIGSWRLSLGVPVGLLGAWFTARLAIQHFVPQASHFEWHVWTNVMALAHPSAELVKSLLTLAFWFICAAIGFRTANRFLRLSGILLPELIVVTFVAGRFVESRQFDAFIPVAVALMLSYAKQHAAWSPSYDQSSDHRDILPDRVVQTQSATAAG